MRVEFATLSKGAALVVPAGDAPTIACMPFIDRAQAERSARLLAARAGADGILLAVEDADRQGFIAVVNQVFRATQSEFFAYVAQDCYAGRRWLERAVAALRRGGMGLLAFNDGKWAGMLAGFGIAARAWVAGKYTGAFFWHEYERHYADAELTVLAMSERRHAYDPDCVMLEVDWDKDGAPVDPGDRALFRRRAAAGFDGRVSDRRLLELFS